MPDKEGSDDEKTTKDVVNKKQKQMMNKEEYTIEMVRKIKKIINPKAVFPPIAQNKVKGEIIKGDDLKIDNKNPVKKKMQKNNLDEEGYDIARDMGRVPKTKDKRDASSYPVSKEVRNMKGDTPMQKEFKKKYGKKATALDAVKQKYKDQMMDVKKEELDLTKIAEAFGGYIVEMKSKIITQAKTGRIIIAPGEGEEKRQQKLITKKYGDQLTGKEKISLEKPKTSKKKSTPSLTRDIPPEERGVQPDAEKIVQQRVSQAKKSGKIDDFTDEPIQDAPDTSKLVRGKKGETIANPVQDTSKKTAEKTARASTGGSKSPLIDQGKYSRETRTVDQDPVTYGSGDGRKAGRRGKTVTYKTPDKITSSKSKQKTPVYKISTTPLQGPKRARSKTATQNRVLQKIRVATKRGAKKPVQRLVKPAAAAVGKGSLATLKKIVKNPVGTAIAAGIARDSFRGIPLPQAPRVSGGKVGRRTAG